MITTNVRLSEADYQKYRIIALKQRKSFAQLVRESLKKTSRQFEGAEVRKKRDKAIETILKEKGFSLKGMSIREAIEEGRRY